MAQEADRIPTQASSERQEYMPMPLAKMRFVGIDPGGREVITAVVSRDTQKFPPSDGLPAPSLHDFKGAM